MLVSYNMTFTATTTIPKEWQESLAETANVLDTLKGISEKFEEVRLQIASNVQEHEKNLPSVLALMSQHSWYPDFEIPISDMRGFEEPALRGDIAPIESYLSGYFRTNAEAIYKSLCEKYPNRAPILDSAFSAYIKGDHILAIPAFLAQADGISHDILKEHFFRAGVAVPAAQTFMSNPAFTSYSQILLAPLSDRGATVRKHTDKLPPSFSGLNRHAVLHGILTNYGTELNSLKAISLLSYLYYVKLFTPP